MKEALKAANLSPSVRTKLVPTEPCKPPPSPWVPSIVPKRDLAMLLSKECPRVRSKFMAAWTLPNSPFRLCSNLADAHQDLSREMAQPPTLLRTSQLRSAAKARSTASTLLQTESRSHAASLVMSLLAQEMAKPCLKIPLRSKSIILKEELATLDQSKHRSSATRASVALSNPLPRRERTIS